MADSTSSPERAAPSFPYAKPVVVPVPLIQGLCLTSLKLLVA